MSNLERGLRLAGTARITSSSPSSAVMNLHLKYTINRRRILMLYTLLLASILFMSVTMAVVSTSSHAHRKHSVLLKPGRLERREETTTAHDSESTVRIKRYELHGRWKALHEVLGLEELPDASYHPEILSDDASDIIDESRGDPFDTEPRQRTSMSKRGNTRQYTSNPLSRRQPVLFLAEDSRQSTTESLSHLRATFQALARRETVDKGRPIHRHLHQLVH